MKRVSLVSNEELEQDYLENDDLVPSSPNISLEVISRINDYKTKLMKVNSRVEYFQNLMTSDFVKKMCDLEDWALILASAEEAESKVFERRVEQALNLLENGELGNDT